MHGLRGVALAVGLLTPAAGLAAPLVDLEFGTALHSESISLGLNPFRWTGPLGLVVPDVSFDSGFVNLTSGPLMDLVVHGDLERSTLFVRARTAVDRGEVGG